MDYICLACAFCVLVVTFSMSGPICEWTISASRVRCVLVIFGMSGPICEWAVSALHVLYNYVLVVTLGISGPIL